MPPDRRPSTMPSPAKGTHRNRRVRPADSPRTPPPPRHNPSNAPGTRQDLPGRRRVLETAAKPRGRRLARRHDRPVCHTGSPDSPAAMGSPDRPPRRPYRPRGLRRRGLAVAARYPGQAMRLRVPARCRSASGNSPPIQPAASTDPPASPHFEEVRHVWDAPAIPPRPVRAPPPSVQFGSAHRRA